ncbi:hypothetical protein TNCV_3304001 [Trichonephila clavipes]|nr:hypothetical protein TNCV_3304001 [Trichonephila clavipes]
MLQRDRTWHQFQVLGRLESFPSQRGKNCRICAYLYRQARRSTSFRGLWHSPTEMAASQHDPPQQAGPDVDLRLVVWLMFMVILKIVMFLLL